MRTWWGRVFERWAGDEGHTIHPCASRPCERSRRIFKVTYDVGDDAYVDLERRLGAILARD